MLVKFRKHLIENSMIRSFHHLIVKYIALFHDILNRVNDFTKSKVPRSLICFIICTGQKLRFKHKLELKR